MGILDIQVNKAFYDESIDTTCRTCQQGKEDEIHLLLKCPSYDYLRSKYIHKHWPDTTNLNLKEMLNIQEEEKTRDIAMFIFYALKRKEYLLSN